MTEIEKLTAEIAELRKELAALRGMVVVVKSGPDHHMPYQPPMMWPKIPPVPFPGGPYPITCGARAGPQIGRLTTGGEINALTYGPDN